MELLDRTQKQAKLGGLAQAFPDDEALRSSTLNATETASALSSGHVRNPIWLPSPKAARAIKCIKMAWKLNPKLPMAALSGNVRWLRSRGQGAI